MIQFSRLAKGFFITDSINRYAIKMFSDFEEIESRYSILCKTLNIDSQKLLKKYQDLNPDTSEYTILNKLYLDILSGKLNNKEKDDELD